MWSDPLLLTIFECFPPRATIFKDSAPRPEEEFELETTRPFHRWFGLGADELFGGRDVLDLGSGFGGSAVWFERYGARSVVGVEIEEDKVSRAAEFARGAGARNVAFVLGRGEALPFAAESFDLITMYDVLEHVVSPRATVDECWRVLRPRGRLATVFPPYYDVLAGSHLHGYATRVPGLNLVFTTRQLRSACKKLLEKQGVQYERHLRAEPTDKLWNQNGLTVRGFLRTVAGTDFRIEELRLLGHRDPRMQDEQRPAWRAFYGLLAGAAQLPVLGEAVCSRVCALLEKPAGIAGQHAAATNEQPVAAAVQPAGN